MELLVAIGVIAMLIAMLLPALRAARRAAQAVQCKAQLTAIGHAVRAYADANGDYIHRPPNRASWLAEWAPPGQPLELRLISPNAVNAYWGTAYFPYLASRSLSESTGDNAKGIVDLARKFWLCPSSVSVDPAFDNTDPTNPVSYGLNGRYTGGTTTIVNGKPVTRWAKYHKARQPSKLIFCHDAAEALMECKPGVDALSAYGTTLDKINLTEWRPGGSLNASKLDAVNEYYRHNRRCQVLWMDGHVDDIGYSDGRDIDQRCYDGW